MARWAIGDVQGCCDELEELLHRIRFSSERDQIWFVGDLVNRGPRSLHTLRLVRSLGENALCVLGNHDLHLLAVALVGAKLRRNDTLNDILAAPDRDSLIEWLLYRPLAHYEPQRGDLLVHAGVVPQWSAGLTLELAREVEQALRHDARGLLSTMYGDEPDHWQPALSGVDRRRFTVNVLTRMRFMTVEGRIDLKQKGKPQSAHKPLIPWFKAAHRQTAQLRIIFGHWSALGLHQEPNILGLDSGCVWGGSLSAANLDDPGSPIVSVPSRQPRSIEQ
ncbi:MAG TPA: symmetrical bis(5'-nucleosyl)-tetraphosphatase [Steroidobacteraceae bacterium]|jgi:bis(5'-nucleosyl)-tetraphosphatase (symmetrical)|nr:symmetrical bis(5'-nucleosyl)-tetraphosphatase [Steroidobacteraceae bacterium]